MPDLPAIDAVSPDSPAGQVLASASGSSPLARCCYMCLKTEPRPEWIELLARPKVVCSEECLRNYSWGLDMT